MASVDPLMEEQKKPLAIRAPLSVLGVFAGLLAGSVIVPGCEFSAAQAERLPVALPLAMPLSLVLAALWLAKHLAPKPIEPRRRWIWFALAMTLAGEVLFNLIAGLVYEPSEFVPSALISFGFFSPILGALFPIVLLLVGAARAAARLRPGSLTLGVARRQVWLVVLGSIAPLEVLFWGVHGTAVSSLASVVWALSAATIPVMIIFLVADGRAARRIEHALQGTRPRAPDEPLAVKGPRIDLGVGDEVHVPEADDASHPYRARPGPRPAVVGAPELAQSVVSRAQRRTAIVLTIAILAAMIGALVLSRLPRQQRAEPALAAWPPALSRR